MCTIVGVLALSLMGPLQDADQPCDLKEVKQEPYCSICKTLDPKVDDKGLCEGCGVTPLKVDVCIKVHFVCRGCDKKLAEDKACCGDGGNEKVTTKARVVLRCEACGLAGKIEGDDCTAPECKVAGKKIRRTCDLSGTWPHGGAPPEKKE